MTDLESKTAVEEEEKRSVDANDLAQVTRFAGSFIVLILGTLMLAEGVIKSIAGSTLFFPELGSSFEFVIGFVIIVLGASVMSMNKSRLLAASG